MVTFDAPDPTAEELFLQELQFEFMAAAAFVICAFLVFRKLRHGHAPLVRWSAGAIAGLASVLATAGIFEMAVYQSVYNDGDSIPTVPIAASASAAMVVIGLIMSYRNRSRASGR